MSWNSFPQVNAHKTYDKHDVIQWDEVGNASCDMNYRLPCRVEVGSLLTLLVQIARSATFGGVLWVAAVVIGPRMQLYVGNTEFLLLGLAGAVLTYTRTRNRLLSLTALTIPLGVLLLIAFASSGVSRSLLHVMWFALACLGMILVADRVATSNLWWCSANPRVPKETMAAYRAGWTHRWIGMTPDLPATDDSPWQPRAWLHGVLRQYPLGAAWLLGAMLLGSYAGLVTALWLQIDTPVLLGLLDVTLCLVCTAWLRFERPGLETLRLIAQAGLRYACEPDLFPRPPWVLRLPDARPPVRWITLQVIAVALGFALTPLLAAEIATSPLGWVSAILAALLIPVWFCLGVVIVAGPAIHAHCLALETLGFEHALQNDWDGYLARLRESDNENERNAIWVGCQVATGFPILLDRKLCFEHVHVVGPTGSGKTALTVSSDLVQLIRHSRGPQKAGAVVVVDCKGDDALFHTAREEAIRAGRPFKFFTNLPDHETYIFNPIAHLNMTGLSIAQRVGVIAQSLSLYHGEGYGRGFFGGASRSLLRTTYDSTIPNGGVGAARPPIESFRELEEAIRENMHGDQDRQLARQLLDTVGSLTEFPQLNLTGETAPGPWEHSIDLPAAIREGQVVYFYLRGVLDTASVGHLARLALFGTIAAAADHLDKTRELANVTFYADEAQCLLSKNAEVVLEQARSLGVSCVLSHQNFSQLELPGGPDMRQLVQANTAVKRYHSARDPETQKYLAAISGRTPYYELAWDQFKGRVAQGLFGPRYAFGKINNQPINVKQTIGDRLEAQDISDMNRRLDESILIVERNEGLTQLNGPVVIRSQFPIDLNTYQRREREPWPSCPGETIVAESPSSGPQPYPEFDDAEVERRMKELRERLRREE